MKQILIGSRGSQLALWQANHIRDLLNKHYPTLHVELKIFTTLGDKIQNKSLPEIGGKGLFTQEIEEALLDKRIDIAVHSLKDLPSALPKGLCLAATPEREDVRDAFVSTRWNRLSDIPENGIIATGSVRRRAQIKRAKPSITFEHLRGNINTRLRKLDKQEWDGIIMASIALKRLKIENRITQYLDPSIFIPAVGQGAIGIEVKSSRQEVINLIKLINHVPTFLAVTGERIFMKLLEGGCSVPLGAWGRIEKEEFMLTGYFSNLEGTKTLMETVQGPVKDSEILAENLAKNFLRQGAKELLTHR